MLPAIADRPLDLLRTRFYGREDVYLDERRHWVREPLDATVWTEHLHGRRRIGIAATPERCSYAAVDFDGKQEQAGRDGALGKLQHFDAVGQSLGLPPVVAEVSRSLAGFHGFYFSDPDDPPSLGEMRGLIQGVLRAAGLPDDGAEGKGSPGIFPHPPKPKEDGGEDLGRAAFLPWSGILRGDAGGRFVDPETGLPLDRQETALEDAELLSRSRVQLVLQEIERLYPPRPAVSSLPTESFASRGIFERIAAGASRHDEMTRYALRLRSFLPIQETLDVVRAFAKATGVYQDRPREAEEEVRKIVRSAYGKSPWPVRTEFDRFRESPSDWPEPIPFDAISVPAFPVGTLPDPLRTFVEAESVATRTPLDLAGVLSLAAVSATISGKFEVAVRSGWNEGTNLYAVVSLPPANLKSPVFADVVRPLEEWERYEVKRVEPDVRDAVIRHTVLQRRLQRVQEQAAKAKDAESYSLTQEAVRLAGEIAESTPPVLPRLIVDDSTPEKLGSLLAEQGGRLAVMGSEGTVFEVLAGRYSANAAPSLETILKAWSGDSLRIDRVTRSEFVRAPRLVLAVCIQPDVLGALTSKPGFRGRGLLGRILWSVPRSGIGWRDSDPVAVPDLVRSRYAGVLERLLVLPTVKDDQGQVEAATVPLSAGAYRRLVSYSAELEPRMRPDGDLCSLTDWSGKLVGTVARLAGVLHFADLSSAGEKDLGEIPADTFDRAAVLGDYFLEHAKAAYQEMGNDPAVYDAKEILAWIRTKDVQSFTQRDLHAAKRSQFPKSEDTLPGLKVLVDRGWIRERVEEKHGPGRKPSPTFDVHPNVGRRE